MATQRPLRVVGQPVLRVDGPAKVTGDARYVADLSVPGMVHGAIVRSPLPHGRIRSLDRTAALSRPGVVAIYTAGDLLSVLKSDRFGPVVRDTPILAAGDVRYEGEPIALVIAESLQVAREAARLVEIDYEDLPVIADVAAALAPGAAQLHVSADIGEFGGVWAAGWEPARNIAGQYHDNRGDVERAFSGADAVFTHRYRLPSVHHYALENHSVIVTPEATGITVHATNQYPFLMVRLVADMLDLPESAVRIVVPYVGGAFGSKEYVGILPLAAAAARRLSRPLKIEYTLEEAFKSGARHGADMTFSTAVTRQGRIVGRKIAMLFDTGAYADQGPRVIRQAGYRAPGPYRIDNLSVSALAVYTNKVPAGAYRGFGASQPIFACESHMDEIASELQLSPVEFRLRNLLDMGDDFAVGDLPLDCDLPGSLRLAVEAMSKPRARSHAASRAPRRATGVGYALGVKNTASGRLPSSAIVRMHADGSATVLVSSVELGQGAHTVLTQIAAEVLGVETGQVRIATPDTATTPFDQRTSSSRTTVHAGSAVASAAEDAVRQILEAAARVLDVQSGSLELRGGSIVGGPVDIDVRAVLGHASAVHGGEVIGVGHFVPAKPEAPTAFGMRAAYWEASVSAVEVAVDLETGQVEILRFIIVGDAGRVINPLTAHGQEEGGVAMAIGPALFEECRFDDGVFLNPSLVDYRVPASLDVPLDLESILLERGDGPGPFGSKGLGESSIISAAPAIANAIAAATGARVRHLPISAPVLWETLTNLPKSPGAA